MGYRAMQLTCYCGQPPERILEVGFTSGRHMVVHFWCATCSRVVFISQSLDKCEQGCPPPDKQAETQSAAEDARFLQSIGIAVGDDQTGMNFRCTLPGTRCQSCLSPVCTLPSSYT